MGGYMSAPAVRVISMPEQRRSLENLFQSLLSSELLAPSKRLWLSSAWISDIAILDNSARQFQALCPEWEMRRIRLSECLDGICLRGGRVVLVLRDEPHNEEFIAAIKNGCGWKAGRIGLILRETQHVKTLVGEYCMLDGSMNFTHNGITLNDERVSYRCDQQGVQEELISLEGRWESRIVWGGS